MHRLARHFGLRVFRIFTRPLAAGTPVCTGGLDYRILGQADALALCADAALDFGAPKVRAAYGRGDFCVAAFQDGQPAGYCWFAFSAAPHMDRAWLDFPPNVLYTYKSFVRPAFRGRGIAAALYRFADPLALQRGRKVALICVESHNWLSIAAARRGGFTASGCAAYIGRARLHSWVWGTAARYGLRFYVPAA